VLYCRKRINVRENRKEARPMEKDMNVTVPKVMNAKQVAEYLGISKQGAYNLMNTESFPTLRVGKRLLVSTDRFLEWIEMHSNGIG
jgi:excisionase family DNA binding protein